MRIGIDVRYLSHGLVGGVHTYVKQFVGALLAIPHEHELILYADSKRPFELTELPARVRLQTLPWHTGLSSVYHDLLLWRHMASDRLDVVHFPGNYGFGPPGTRTIITLHDAINILPLHEIVRGHAKNARTIMMMSYLHLLTVASVRRADLLLTVSEHAKADIAGRSRIPPEKIVAVPHAPTPDLQRLSDTARLAEVRRRHTLEGSFVLADGLKNPAVLIRAWHALSPQLRSGRKIVFFARRSDVLPIVHEAVAAGDARLLVQPSREDLIALYSMADAFVFPSWIEGFGIPLLEAMTCGAPVIASDRGSIPEVAGDAALLADAEDDAAFARHLTAVLGDSAVANQLRRAGCARAAEFSWDRTAQQILSTYLRVGNGSGRFTST